MPLIERPGLPMPFCKDGDKNPIQVASSEALTNFETGFPILQATPLGMAGAEEVKREDFNGVLNLITSILYGQQMGTPNMWRQYVPGTEQTTQTRVAYPKGAQVYFQLTNDITSAVEIISMQENNTVIPIDNSGETPTNNIGLGKAWDYAAKNNIENGTTNNGTYFKITNNFIFQMSNVFSTFSVPQDTPQAKEFIFPVSFSNNNYFVHATWQCENFNRQMLYFVPFATKAQNRVIVNINNLQAVNAQCANLRICVFGFL